MAKDAALSDVSKTELAELYSKLKARAKADKVRAAKEGEQLLEDAMCIAAAGGLGYLMGQRHEAAEIDALKNNKTPEETETLIAESGQIAGIDLDLLVGAAAMAAGMFKLGGKMSDAVRRVGTGGLAAYAARIGNTKGRESASEPVEE
jgi:hypothetical protein